MAKFYIYGLHEDGSEEIRYVGKTIAPQKRLMEHLRIKDGQVLTHKDEWIRHCLQNGKSVIMKILEECTKLNVDQRERYWINYYAEKGGVTNKSRTELNKNARWIIDGKAVGKEQLIDHFREVIKTHGTQLSFAKSLGVSAPLISDILKGNREPGERILKQLGIKQLLVYQLNDQQQ